MRLGDPGFGESVSVVRSTDPVYDDYGDLVPGTGVDVETVVPGCAVAPLKQGEDATVDGAVLLDGFTVYMPFGTDVTAADRLLVRGRVYHVDGVPGVWVSPYSAAHPKGVELVVRGA